MKSLAGRQLVGRDKPMIWAHRGAHGNKLATTFTHPPVENTLEAFVAAANLGAEGIELDVRTTQDGEVVVFHDLDLKRLTNGAQLDRIEDVSWPTLSELSLQVDGNMGRVPSLRDVVDAPALSNVLWNIELKHDTSDFVSLVRGVARILQPRPAVAERVIVSSFDPRLLVLSQALMPDVPRALLLHDKQRVALTPFAALSARSTGAFALHAQHTTFSPSRMAAWKRVGVLLVAWTVNDPDQAKMLMELGVDGLIGDDPVMLRQALV